MCDDVALTNVYIDVIPIVQNRINTYYRPYKTYAYLRVYT